MNETANFNISDVQAIASQLIKDPAGFYRNMPRQGGYTQPLLFITVIAIFTGLLFAILSLFGGPYMGGMPAGILSVFLLPVGMIIWCLIGSAILFVIWKLMGSTQNYETAFRCQAFAGAIVPITALLSLVPYLGTIVAVVWACWLLINASIEVHAIGRQKARVVFSIIGLLLVVLNISNERMARQMQEHAVMIEDNAEGVLQDMDNMSPEQAGKALGEFLKGLEEGQGQE